jgi:hypothetical protein
MGAELSGARSTDTRQSVAAFLASLPGWHRSQPILVLLAIGLLVRRIRLRIIRFARE